MIIGRGEMVGQLLGFHGDVICCFLKKVKERWGMNEEKQVRFDSLLIKFERRVSRNVCQSVDGLIGILHFRVLD